MSTSPAPLEVLVVDDDDGCRELNAAVVERLGHRCRTATDGNDALAQLAARPADVIVSDWEMPGMNGAELCQRTRSSSDDEPYTYFIMVTALSDRAHLIGAMEAGADDFQRKPVNIDELEARLTSAARVVQIHRKLAAKTAELRGDSARFYVASRTDALTGAGNRLGLEEEVASLISRATRYGTKCSLAIADLDYFKAYNDRFGHIAGDAALRRVAEAMSGALRSVDRLYRFGGEEFVTLLVEQTLGSAECAMDRLRRAVERLGIDSPATSGSLTMSVGIAELDTSIDHSAAEWIQRADSALYEAKSSGRNRVISTLPPRPAPSSRAAIPLEQ